MEISQVSGCAATGYSEVVLKCKAKELQEEDGLRFGLEVAGDGIQGAAITHIGPATDTWTFSKDFSWWLYAAT